MASLTSKIDEEVEELKKDIVRIGHGNASGQYEVEYGVLFDDEKVQQHYEALMGTLKAAKKKGVVNFQGQMLLKGAHDKVAITLLEPPADAPAPTPAAAPAAEEPTPKPDAAPAAAAAAAASSPAPKPRMKTAAEMMIPPTEKTPEMMAAFGAINDSHPDKQCEYFLKSFIFALGDHWKDVPALLKTFQKHASDTSSGSNEITMNHIQASDFLQKHGKTRTGSERKAELNDVDINNDGNISFIEYLLLHYKVMILTEFYKRYELTPDEDLSKDGIGVVNVGHKLVDELLTLPKGMDPALEAAIEQFTDEQKARSEKIEALKKKAEAGGVKGMAAKNELIILESGDQTGSNRLELTLMAAKRRADKRRGSNILKEQKAKAEAELKAAHDAQRARMAARRAMFEKKA